MKKYLFLSLIFLLPLSLFAQTCLAAFGQNGGYDYLTNHAEIQMTTYGRDGTTAVIVTSHISKVFAIPGGTASHFESTAKDLAARYWNRGAVRLNVKTEYFP